jgi:phosphoserine phosphatase RsbU/P
MEWSYPELRHRLMKAELWPQGRMARLACYLAALAAVLFLSQSLLGLFRLSWGQHLGGWVSFLVFFAFILFFILAFRWVRRRILWRLRNRLIVTYVFIGVIPAVLLVAMGLITLYGLGGQFAVFVVTSEVHAQLRSMEAVNSAVTNELAAHLEHGEKPVAEALVGLRKSDPTWSRRQVCAWYGEKPLSLCEEFQGASLALPGFLKGKFQDIVRDHDQLHLRVASALQVGPGRLTVVTSEPFDKELVGKIASDLGEITLYTSAFTFDAKPAQKANSSSTNESTTTPTSKSGIVITTGPQGTKETKGQEELRASFTVGAMPESAGTYDREITFGTPLAVVDWSNGQPQQVGALLQVTTRPAVLYSHLFAALGEFVRGVAYILMGVAIFFNCTMQRGTSTAEISATAFPYDRAINSPIWRIRSTR